MRVAGAGHVVFAVTMIALGVIGLITGGFTPIWSGVPKAFPAREVVAYLCAALSLLTGIGLLWQRTAGAASRGLLVFFLLWFALVRVSRIFVAPTELNTWWACGATLIMTGAVWVLYVWLAGDRSG